jgi:HAD superfamily hydrolase (TIGR01490 family)
METRSASGGPQRLVAAFFDLDRTLIDVNSGVLYALYEYRAGRIRSLQMLESLLWTALYHLSLVDIEVAYRRALAHYRGERESVLLERTRAWFEQDVAHRLQPGARAALDEHGRQGHRTVLLTSSSCYMAQIVAGAWGLDDWIANGFPTDESGRLTGAIEAPFCYGSGKVARAEAWAEQHGADLALAYFYTDSLSDLPMLERVGHPRVVNPDPRLRRTARRRGWPILDWKPGSAAAGRARLPRDAEPAAQGRSAGPPAELDRP